MVLQLKQGLMHPQPGTQSMPFDTLRRNDCHRELQDEPSAKLRQIIKTFQEKASDHLHDQYAIDLGKSLNAFQAKDHVQSIRHSGQLPTKNAIKKHMANCHKAERFLRQYLCDTIVRLIENRTEEEDSWLLLGHAWPCVSPVCLLEILQTRAKYRLSQSLHRTLVAYGVVLTHVQRSHRIFQALEKGFEKRFLEEVQNCGHESWSPVQRPDWLLMEIDGNIMIRDVQYKVAEAVIAPKSGGNSLLQMNMGQGKTSCVVPMAMAVLANGKQLCRLVVPKALLLQTAQVVQSKLGGLVGRPLVQVGWARQVKITESRLRDFKSLHYETKNHWGIMLTCHDFLLSFKLSGLQYAIDEDGMSASTYSDKIQEQWQAPTGLVSKMLEFQEELERISRDLLDESDITLAVKTQLIYPSGSHEKVDGHPHRWMLCQFFLYNIYQHLTKLSKERRSNHDFELLHREEGLPIIFLPPDSTVDAVLKRELVEDVLQGRIAPLQKLSTLSTEDKESLRLIFSDATTLDVDSFERILSLMPDPLVARKQFLLVRGFLAFNILLVCLKKRWNVNYGLHVARAPIAVPYEAKGVPSEQSEFGHPDVTITLTCLAYYYAGLNSNEFYSALRHALVQSDNPGQVYEQWIRESKTLPQPLRTWNVINLEDGAQVNELWQKLRLQRSVIEYYLNQLVFPAHARQFTLKIQASGWDIPLIDDIDGQKGSIPRVRTTGFSGTNDNRYLLPLTIQQDDLPKLQHTSAEVLTYLLQARNERCFTLRTASQGRHGHQGGQRMTEKGFLEELAIKRIRVLIDAGAFILEKPNKDLAREWLHLDKLAKAAVYFDKDHRPMVLYRNANKAETPLISSSYWNNLGGCLVYFDEAHTRGVDLPLGMKAEAALTIGLGQTKDHTVQAAMRLRQLASSQQLSFFLPPEVEMDIRKINILEENHTIKSNHVILWLLEQTCRTNCDLQGLFVSQGIDYCHRTHALWDYRRQLHVNKEVAPHNDTTNSIVDESVNSADVLPRLWSRVIQAIYAPERQNLENMYSGGKLKGEASSEQDASENSSSSNILSQTSHNLSSSPMLQNMAGELRTRLQEHIKLTGSVLVTASMVSAMDEVEQERQVEFQVEEERQIYLPEAFASLRYPGLHDAIRKFITSGSISDHALPTVGEILSQTHASRNDKITYQDTANVYASIEFTRTIQKPSSTDSVVINYDAYTRDTEWVLWNGQQQTALIITAEEAEDSLPLLKAALAESGSYKKGNVQLILYAAPWSKPMIGHFNQFQYYAFPTMQTDEIQEVTIRPNDLVRAEIGFLGGRLYFEISELEILRRFLNLPVDEKFRKQLKPLCRDPIAFMSNWLSARQQRTEFIHTPMGFLCQDRLLPKDHPFFILSSSNRRQPTQDDTQQRESIEAVASMTTSSEWSFVEVVEAETPINRQVIEEFGDEEGGNDDDLDSDVEMENDFILWIEDMPLRDQFHHIPSERNQCNSSGRSSE